MHELHMSVYMEGLSTAAECGLQHYVCNVAYDWMTKIKGKFTYDIIDPLDSLIVRKVDPTWQMFAAKQAVQVLIAHVLYNLCIALLLNVPPSLSKLFPADPACHS